MAHLKGLQHRRELDIYRNQNARASDLMQDLYSAVVTDHYSSADFEPYIGDKIALSAVRVAGATAPLITTDKRDLGRIWPPAVIVGTILGVDVANGGTLNLLDGFAVTDARRSGYRLGPIFNSSPEAHGPGAKLIALGAVAVSDIFQRGSVHAEFQTAVLLEPSGGFLARQLPATRRR